MAPDPGAWHCVNGSRPLCLKSWVTFSWLGVWAEVERPIHSNT